MKIQFKKFNSSHICPVIYRSDVLGHVLPLVGKDWSQAGITTLFNEIDNNGYQFVYLSARAIGQATMTRYVLMYHYWSPKFPMVKKKSKKKNGQEKVRKFWKIYY